MLVSLSLTGSVLLDLAAVGFLVYLYYGVRSYYRLSHIPGPKLWGWTLFPLMKLHLDAKIYDKFGELAQEYGPLVRVAPNTLLVSDPEVMRRMNAAKTTYSRADWYLAIRLVPGEDNILSTLSDPRHDELRRKMGMGYSGKENVTLEADIDEVIRDLIKLVETKYISKGNKEVKMDLARKMSYFTSDVMSKLAFDAKFGDLRDDNDNLGYINEVETVFPKVFCTCVTPKLLDWLTKAGILGLMAPSESSKFGFGKVLQICKQQIAKRFDSDGKLVDGRRDMMGSFLRRGLTQREAEQEAVVQLAAGSDTTATGMRGTLRGLIENQRAYKKLQAELDAAALANRIPSDHHTIISDEQARKLPYLQACIKEGLRFFPPVTGMLAKQTPPQGDTVCGYFVPGGVSMGYCAKAIHHSKALYGPDEEDFRPERWIHTSEGGDEPDWEKIKAIEKNNTLIFGHGKYQCLGKEVAMVELNKVISEMVRRFDITYIDPSHPWDTACFGIHFQKNMWVEVQERSSGSVKKA